MTDRSVKILSLGPFNGRITECLEKMKTMNSKHGPFDAVLTVGDVFGDCKPEDRVVRDLLSEKLDVPCPTYFICGAKPLPENVLSKAETNNGEICANLTFLGQQGILTTTEGLRIAFLSGAYEQAKFFNAKVDEEESKIPNASNPEPPATGPPHLYRVSDVNALKSVASSGIDILLTYEWPKCISRNSSNATSALSVLESKDVGSLGVQCVAELAAVLQPRYHYAATPDSEGSGELVERRSVFFEREPYANDGAAGRVAASKVVSHVTRFIGLGAQGSDLKSRWLHAMTLIPAIHATPDVLQVRPANTTECPFVLTLHGPRGVKRLATGGNEEDGGNFFYRGDPVAGKRKGKGEGGHQGPPETYTCRICHTKGHWIQDCPDKKQESGDRGSQGGGPPEGYTCRICKNAGHWIQHCPEKTKSAADPKEEECWFCLSSPNLSKHLIASIGEEIYVALAKGPLVNPDPKKAVVPGGGHVIIIPIGHYASWDRIPAETRESVKTELSKYKDALRRMYAKFDASMVVWELCRSGPRQMHHHIQAVPVPNALMGKVKETFIKEGAIAGMTFSEGGGKAGDFFHVEIGVGESLVHALGKGRMNLQFGRQVMARVLGVEERADWKKVAGSVEEETRMTQEFKAAFGKFEP